MFMLVWSIYKWYIEKKQECYLRFHGKIIIHYIFIKYIQFFLT